ncbi:MAG TPA: helicase-associated domain-containing protein [Actinomycetospora sp.]|uniref:helicase-associated domain-containing protein n=1 Tax=Actinomycetospora sp. TaxID=1872135 RepID=UPI002F3EE215
MLASAHGAPSSGLKATVAEAVAAALADRPAVVARVDALEEAHRGRLLDMLGSWHVTGRDRVAERLITRGMVVEAGYRLVVPREVAIAAWLRVARVTGPPALPPAHLDRGAAEAAQEFLRCAGLVLDHARTSPLGALKSGGVGKRERGRLVKTLGLPDDGVLAMILDLTSATGLLGVGADGYTTTDRYPTWRRATAARRWAELVACWVEQPHPSLHRADPDGTETKPPIAPAVNSGELRRALLRAGRDGGSLSAAADEIGWYAGFFGPGPWRTAVTQAALAEAVRLGVADSDGLAPLGMALVAVGADVAALAGAAERVLGDVDCQVVLQSDLTAIVTGTPDDEGVRLLTDAAEVENRGTATVHRFSPRTVRRALDLGWTSDQLLAGLHALSGTEVPQPLDYLVRDVARVHGSIRVHEVRTCVVAEEALIEELAHGRALRKLGWRRLTREVLASPEPPSRVLTMLREAGYSPVLDDGSGAIAVERAPVEQAYAEETLTTPGADPADVVRRLRAGPAAAGSPTVQTLAGLNGRLSVDELDLLAHALDHRVPVHITYRVNSGSVTERAITPQALMHRWLVSWCHLRNDRREFTVASILAVRAA